MKSSTVTIRVDPKLDRELKRLSRSLKRSKSDIARAAEYIDLASISERIAWRVLRKRRSAT